MKFLAASLLFVLGILPLPAQTVDAFQAGLVALKQNRPAEALEQFTRAERENPANARVRNFRGITLAQLDRVDEAATEYREAIRLDPKSPDAYRNLGYLEWMRHRPDAARHVLDEALKLAPDDPYANYYRGRVDLDSKDYAPAVAHMEKSPGLWPADPAFGFALAEAYLSLHRETAARQALSRVQNLKLTDAQSVQYGALLVAAQDKAAAIEVFQRMQTAHHDASWALFNLALAQLLAGHPQESVSIARSVATPQGSPQAWTLLGIAAAETQDRERSISAFRMAAQFAPGQEERWLDLTRELMDSQRYVEAVSAAKQGLERLPRSYALRLRLGAAYMKSGQYKEAEGVFRDLIAQGDTQPTSAIGLAQALLRETQPDAAAQVLQDTEKRLGTSFLLVYFEGIALDRAAKPEEALRRFQEAVRLNPRSAEAHQWLGMAELRARQVDPAITDLKETLRLDPQNQPARRLLAQAYAMRKQPEQAAQYLQKIEPGEVPKTMGEESADFFFPAWESPPAVQ
ncbi:MAG: tetratricopeptide repeat protein [Terriglobia bacterium]